MFTLTPRTNETRTLSTGTTSNPLVPNGVPLSVAEVTIALQKPHQHVVNHKLVEVGTTYLSASTVRIACFRDNGTYMGLAPKLSAFWSDRPTNTGNKVGQTISALILKGSADLDAINKELDMRFMIGMYDANGQVVTAYDDRPALEESYESGTAGADPFAEFRPESASTARERVGIGFINGYLKSTQDGVVTWYKAAECTLKEDDKPSVATFLNMKNAGCQFRAMAVPTTAVEGWLSAKAAPTPEASTETTLGGLLNF